MNRSFLLLSLILTPVIAYAIVYTLGFSRLSSGFPFVRVLGCIPILSLGDGCGLVVDWFPFWLDVLTYTILGYAILLGYYRIAGGAKPRLG